MKTATESYNGWANYATWRVNLEVFDGFDPDGQWQTAEDCEEMVCGDDGWVLEGVTGLARDYARAFLADVDWQEIADAINEAHELTDPDTVTDADVTCAKCGREYDDLTPAEVAAFDKGCPSDDCPGNATA
jgi:hypothetical protein